jgi:hypothetical protein
MEKVEALILWHCVKSNGYGVASEVTCAHLETFSGTMEELSVEVKVQVSSIITRRVPQQIILVSKTPTS